MGIEVEDAESFVAAGDPFDQGMGHSMVAAEKERRDPFRDGHMVFGMPDVFNGFFRPHPVDLERDVRREDSGTRRIENGGLK